jgi:fucose permease
MIVMGIVGGAVFTPIMGLIATHSMVRALRAESGLLS